MLSARPTRRFVIALCAVLLAVPLAMASDAGSAGDRWNVRVLTLRSERSTADGRPLVRPAARTTAWCGASSQSDLQPNARAGHSVHWVYATAADEPDQLSLYAGAMQADADTIDAWWRAQDPVRAPRNDVAPFACGLQLDITAIRLRQSSAELASVDTRFESIANTLYELGFSSRHTKYVVYYDGVVEPEICGQGGSADDGLGFAIVYVRACLGVPFATTAAHELLHTLGAVPDGAPHMCPEPLGAHACDDGYDVMFPFGDETPLGALALDSGRDDYYAHAGGWADMQDAPWLVQLDRQVPLAVQISGPGAVSADVPGLQCASSCTTTWNAGTQLTLAALPAAGAKLVRWGPGCNGHATCTVTTGSSRPVSALFAPAEYRLRASVAGRGLVRASGSTTACPPRCSLRVASHESLRLRAVPAKGWRFRTWTGACRGARTTCTVPMTADTNVRAIFVRA